MYILNILPTSVGESFFNMKYSFPDTGTVPYVAGFLDDKSTLDANSRVV